MSFKISLAGDLGSGKSTVGKILSRKLGAEVYSTGTIQRQIRAPFSGRSPPKWA